ncbi:helix-turn-helix domain-containing protein [Streptomyces sp. NPDC058691]|uniref:AraC family transcriptional regulator n=1 Tax=Streptomyces sp. NPDC058691 TaxID=3346601 RepID=UPI00365B4063
MLLVDLDTVPPGERVAAFHHAMTDESVPNDIVHEESGAGIHARMELWRVGGLELFATRNSGFELRRTAGHVRRRRNRPIVAVSLQTGGVGRAEVGGEQRLLGPDEVFVFHELTPRRYGWSGDGAGRAVTIETERLGLPVEVVAKAGLHLRASPLHDLVLGHLRGLWRDPAVLEADPGAPALASATTDLVRALLISAAYDEREPATRAVMDDTLLARVMAHVRRHLTEPCLTPERIAADHAISERHLYALLRRAGISLEQWIITERLEEARRLLASVRHDHLTIAAVAARCGFGNASHFARRFHAAYGMTPREWRRNGRA